jgi:hypothetical protein
MSGTIDPNTPLLVTLPARQWNSLLSCAGEGLAALNALIGEVQRQCVQQSRVPEDAPAEHIPARTNGAAAEARE